MDPKRVYPALCITEEKLTNEQILNSFNTAFNTGFAFDFVLKVTKFNNTRIIHFDDTRLNELTEDDILLEEFDKFYRDLDKHGSLWIEAEADNNQADTNQEFLYSRKPIEGFWEVTYANSI